MEIVCGIRMDYYVVVMVCVIISDYCVVENWYGVVFFLW